MWKLFKNYSKYNKNNIFQIVCLNLLILIMVLLSLGVLFSNEFINQQINQIADKSNLATPIYRTTPNWNTEPKRLFKHSDKSYFEKNAYFDMEHDLMDNSTLSDQIFPNLIYTYFNHKLDEEFLSQNSTINDNMSTLPLEIKKATVSFDVADSSTNLWNMYSCGIVNNNPNLNVQVGCNSSNSIQLKQKAKSIQFSNIFNIKNRIGNYDKSVPYSMHQISKYTYFDKQNTKQSNFFNLEKLKLFITKYNNNKFYFLTSKKADAEYHSWIINQHLSDSETKAQFMWENQQTSHILYWLFLTGLFSRDNHKNPTYQISNLLQVVDPIDQQIPIQYDVYGFNEKDNKLTDLYNRPVLMHNCDTNNCGKISNAFSNYSIVSGYAVIPVLITKYYAKINHLKLNQTINVYNFKFKIVGFATSSLTSYSPHQASKQVSSVWMTNYNADYFEKHLISVEKINLTPNIFGFRASNFPNKTIYEKYDTNKIWSPITDTYFQSVKVNNLVVTHANRRLDSQRKTIMFVIILIFVLSILIVLVIVTNTIQKSKKLIGVLKASGYETWSISAALGLSISCPILISSLLGAIFSGLLGYGITLTYIPFTSLLSVNVYYNVGLMFVGIFVPFLIILVATTLMSRLVASGQALSMIYNIPNIKVQKIRSMLLRPIQNWNYRIKISLLLTVTKPQTLFLIFFGAVIGVVSIIFSLFSAESIEAINSQLPLNENATFLYSYTTDNKIYNLLNPISKTDNKLKIQNNYDHFNYLYTTKDVSNRSSLLPDNNFFTKLKSLETISQLQKISIYKSWFTGSQAKYYYSNIVNSNCSKILSPKLTPFAQQACFYIRKTITNNGSFTKIYFSEHPDLIVDFGEMLYNSTDELPYLNIPVNIGSTKIEKNIGNLPKQDIINFQKIKITLPDYNLIATNPTYEKYNKLEPVTKDPTLWSDVSLHNFNAYKKALTKTLSPKFNQKVVYLPVLISQQLAKSQNFKIGDLVYLKNNDFNIKLIGYVTEIAKNLNLNSIITPDTYFANATSDYIKFNNKLTDVLNFANAKISKSDSNELQKYATIIDTSRSYQLFATPTNYMKYRLGLTNIINIPSIKAYYLTSVSEINLILILTTILLGIIGIIVIVVASVLLIKSNYSILIFFKSLGMSTRERILKFIYVYTFLITIGILIGSLIMPKVTSSFTKIFIDMLQEHIVLSISNDIFIISAVIILFFFCLFFLLSWKIFFWKKPIYIA